MATQTVLQADVIVVGSGPGGATVARALARAGRQVLLLEAGRDERQRPDYGTYLGPLRYAERGSFLFTAEGMQVVRPQLLGGATSMYCGCAAPPPAWLNERYGINLESEVAETVAELSIAVLPADLRGTASTRLAQAGLALGQLWQPQRKLMRPARSRCFNCSANCMLGCRCGAKWNAAEYALDARAAGATLLTSARVTKLLRSGNRVTGVAGFHHGQPFEARAATVVLAAGGIGTPRLLQASGVAGAGEGVTMDTTTIVYGVTKERGSGREPPMTWSWHNQAEGYMLSTLVDPWLLYPLITALSGWQRPLSWPNWGRTLGVMMKLTDEVAGHVGPARISKPLTERDRERLKAAEAVARRLLREAGADPATVFTTPLRGTHPGSTVRIGQLVDIHLRSEIEGLYVCDASVFPQALGQPTVLTIIGLGKRLAKHLLARG